MMPRAWHFQVLLLTSLAPQISGHEAARSTLNDRNALFEDRIPLSVVSYDGGLRLLVDVRPQRFDGEWLPKQRLLLDTGSSTLAFCKRQFIVAAQYEPSNFIACNEYNPGGKTSGYWGPFVTGAIQVAHLTWKLSNYSIMVQETLMPCTDGIDGIFGIAFGQLDTAFVAADRFDIIVSDSNFTCPSKSSGSVSPPLMEHLYRGRSQKLGIFWAGKKGHVYLGEAAVNNKHYSNGHQYALTAKLGEQGYYNIELLSISVGKEIFGHTGPASPCILDTGTPTIVLPQEVYDASTQQNGTLVLRVAGFNSASNDFIDLVFDLGLLNMFGWVTAGNEATGLILGLPLWAFYYTVFDIRSREVVFIPNSLDVQHAEHASNATHNGGRFLQSFNLV